MKNKGLITALVFFNTAINTVTQFQNTKHNLRINTMIRPLEKPYEPKEFYTKFFLEFHNNFE